MILFFFQFNHQIGYHRFNIIQLDIQMFWCLKLTLTGVCRTGVAGPRSVLIRTNFKVLFETRYCFINWNRNLFLVDSLCVWQFGFVAVNNRYNYNLEYTLEYTQIFDALAYTCTCKTYDKKKMVNFSLNQTIVIL